MKKIISPVPTDELEFLGGILVDNSSRQLAMSPKLWAWVKAEATEEAFSIMSYTKSLKL